MIPRKLNDIRFITPNSFGYMSYKAKSVNKEAVFHLLSSIRKIENVRNLFFGTFPGEVRPETVSEDFMLEIKPFITNRRISLGLQSGSNKILKSIRRGHTVEEGLEAIDVLLKTSFTPVVDIIIGIPGATEEDELQTLDIIGKYVRKDVTFRAHVFMPLPGTKLEKTEYKPVSPKVRKILGKYSTRGKIEGSWSHQELYAKTAWETIKQILNQPAIKGSSIL